MKERFTSIQLESSAPKLDSLRPISPETGGRNMSADGTQANIKAILWEKRRDYLGPSVRGTVVGGRPGRLCSCHGGRRA